MLHGAMGWKKAGKSWPRKKLKWVVKHSKAEFTRKRPGKLSAGTQQLDRQWEHAKGAVPKQRITKRLGKIKEELWAYLYQGYWRQQVSGSLFHKLGQLCAETRWSPKKKRGCYNLRSEIWWPSRCFQQKEVIVWPRYKEFWLSCIWEISSMFLKHPRGLQIRMRSLKMVHFKIDNTPVLLLATWPCFCIMGHVPWFFNGQCVVIHWFLHR